MVLLKNKEERYSLTSTIRYPFLSLPRLSDTRYSANGTYQIPVTQLKEPKGNGDMQQQSEIKMRHLPRYTDLSVMGVSVGLSNFFFGQSTVLTTTNNFS